jgi:hypothetical protein
LFGDRQRWLAEDIGGGLSVQAERFGFFQIFCGSKITRRNRAPQPKRGNQSLDFCSIVFRKELRTLCHSGLIFAQALSTVQS